MATPRDVPAGDEWPQSPNDGDPGSLEPTPSSRDAAPASEAPTMATGGVVEPVDPAVSDEILPNGLTDRYEDWGLLGRGGMGEVRLCRDRHIGRKIALKVIRRSRATRERARARFMREAKIQGQLEHPAVVPVYDLGEAPDGRVYFTMKQVFGRTLEEIVKGLREDDPEIIAEYSRRRLLDAFARVCLAVDYIHESGIVHRDLKPSNVMLGRYGEVYVLDWGLAKLVQSEPDEIEDREPERVTDSAPTLDTDAGHTAAGELMGTPGYMAPEQLDGGVRPIGVAADIYALGAILFELLAWQPLHPRGTVQRMIGSTIRGADARCSVRAPERNVPPELEAICITATADDPDARYPSARALQDAIVAWLDGERDLQVRASVAQRWAERAAKTTAAVLEGDPDPSTRSRALEEAGRALALDPENASARATIVRLLVEPPRIAPPQAQAHLIESEREAERSAARGAVIGFGAWLLFAPGVLILGVRRPWMMALLLTFTIAALTVSWIGGRSARPEQWSRPVAFVLGMAGLVLVGRLFGPLILVPGLAATTAAAFSIQVTGPRRWFYLVTAAAVVLVPLGLEMLDVLPDSYMFIGDRIIIVPHMTDLPRIESLAFLCLATIAAIIVPPFLLSRTRDGLRAAERDLAVHAWQMEQLLPPDARTAFDETTGSLRQPRRQRGHDE